jgi:hypothetical protein
MDVRTLLAFRATVLLAGVVAFISLSNFEIAFTPRPLTPTVIESVTPDPSVTPTSSVTPIPIKLFCFSSETKLLRASNVRDQCLKSERSLGAYELVIPSGRPTDVNPLLKVRFLAAQEAAKESGNSLLLTSGFRSYAAQKELFRLAVVKYGSESEASKRVLPPELSHHPWGLALDINYPNNPLATKWLETNGAKFGLCRVYINEWWHFEGAIAPGLNCPKQVPDASYSLE